MKIQSDFKDYSEIYDSIQTGEITRPNGESLKIGDVVNDKFIMATSFHLEQIEQGEFYFRFVETVKNNSTGETFVEEYIATEYCPLCPTMKHLETLNVEKFAIV